MTPEQKQQIDAMDYESMLSLYRSAPVGHPLFAGDTGDYFSKAMKDKRAQRTYDKCPTCHGYITSSMGRCFNIDCFVASTVPKAVTP